MAEQRNDEQLVAAALDGDRDAFAAIYDRHAAAVYSVCSHMLSNRDDAADATGDVFLAAAERLGQLRDPSRLRYWLLAIARRNVYRRSSARSRTFAVAEVGDVTDQLVTDGADVELGADDADLVRIVQDAAGGLDEADRMVLELHLHGCEGADLADVLGVSANSAYQATFRMKERLERSLGALLVARRGRADCEQLDQLLRPWDGTFSVLWRKRVARHVDGCEVCERRKRAVPALLLEGIAGATPVVAVPIAVRERVVAEARPGATTARAWSDSGFPPGDGRRIRPAVLGTLAAVVAVIVAVVVLGTTTTERVRSDPSTPTLLTTVPATDSTVTSAPESTCTSDFLSSA